MANRINAGLYIFKTSILDRIPVNGSFSILFCSSSLLPLKLVCFLQWYRTNNFIAWNLLVSAVSVYKIYLLIISYQIPHKWITTIGVWAIKICIDDQWYFIWYKCGKLVYVQETYLLTMWVLIWNMLTDISQCQNNFSGLKIRWNTIACE